MADIKSQSKEISGKEDIARVATISSREREIGDVIADAIEKVGKDGVVNVEEGQTFGLELEFTEGMQFDKGYLSPYMVTDPERMEAVLEERLHGEHLLGEKTPADRCRRRRGLGPARRIVVVLRELDEVAVGAASHGALSASVDRQIARRIYDFGRPRLQPRSDHPSSRASPTPWGPGILCSPASARA